MKEHLTDEWSVQSSDGELVVEVDTEHCVSQQGAGFERYSAAAVWRQEVAGHINQHQEHAGQQQTDHVEQWSPPYYNLQKANRF